ncbi:hypothetical protein A3Q56_04878 [Intoshia linei]|uniref:Uncharacterized protein n=1 Tax=Intoshia linei TaxID=1819745 RepID=A0A177AZG2_9BILA|nr:hypothetical protein A3Q56_04878 [Intoshia linei]
MCVNDMKRIWGLPCYPENCYYYEIILTVNLSKSSNWTNYPLINSSKRLALIENDISLKTLMSENSLISDSSLKDKLFTDIHVCTQKPETKDVNTIISTMQLTKRNSELLASWLNKWNLTDAFRSYYPEKWYLFIDKSTSNLKVILIHVDQSYPLFIIGYLNTKKESYDNIKLMLNYINYDNFGWRICGDFKILAFLMGIKTGNVKYPCFFCLFRGKNKTDHYSRNCWHPREDYIIREFSVYQDPLINKSKIILPPLYITLGLARQFPCKLFKQYNLINHVLKLKFPNVSESKLKNGILIGPQINLLAEHIPFYQSLDEIEKSAWSTFINVKNKFLGNKRDSNYKDLIEIMINNYGCMGWLISYKVHYMNCHVSLFMHDCGKYSDQHGERFHQTLSVFEKRYKKQNALNMIGDYL